jgi:hypothetical protein
MQNPLLNIATSVSDLSGDSSFHDLMSLGFVLGMMVYWLGAFFIMYHLIRFGVGNQPKKIALLFLCGSLILSIITTLFFAQIIL